MESRRREERCGRCGGSGVSDVSGVKRAACAVLLFLLLPCANGGAGGYEGTTQGSDDVPHSRQKRLLWITSDGRLALPPGTALTITPTLSLPFVRYPPDGFLSNMSISLPFTIIFDKLGLTDNENPYGVLPPLLARSMGSSVADYIGALIAYRRHSGGVGGFRGRRSSIPPPPVPPRPPAANFHGGERALLYTVVEDLLDNFGMDGKACLLRAICEVHGRAMHKFGVVGEILRLFLTASKSPFANILDEYVAAERTGQDDGECIRYFKDCPKSIFANSRTALYKGTDQDEDSSKTDERPFTTVIVTGLDRKEEDSGGGKAGGGVGKSGSSTGAIDSSPLDSGTQYNVLM